MNEIMKWQASLEKEFKELSAKALEYRTKMLNAKTSLKKEIYSKKLEKTNKKVYGILAQLTLLNGSQK